MIFQFAYGKKDCLVRVYGYPDGTVTVDGDATALNSSGYADIVLKAGSHTFEDGYVGGNSKVVNIASDTTVVVGFYFGGAGTKDLPAGAYSRVVGTVSGSVTQSGKGGSIQNQWTECWTWATVAASGAINENLYNAKVAELASDSSTYATSRTSGTKTKSISKGISASGGASLTISLSSSASQDGGDGYLNVSGTASVSDIYVY